MNVKAIALAFAIGAIPNTGFADEPVDYQKMLNDLSDSGKNTYNNIVRSIPTTDQMWSLYNNNVPNREDIIKDGERYKNIIITGTPSIDEIYKKSAALKDVLILNAPSLDGVAKQGKDLGDQFNQYYISHKPTKEQWIYGGCYGALLSSLLAIEFATGGLITTTLGVTSIFAQVGGALFLAGTMNLNPAVADPICNSLMPPSKEDSDSAKYAASIISLPIGIVMGNALLDGFLPKPNYETYRNNLNKGMNKAYRANKATIDPNGLRGREYAYDLDHIIPGKACYTLGAPPSLCNSRYNLQVIPASLNRSIGSKGW